jgi:predicted ArsR family transcriptional regulator
MIKRSYSKIRRAILKALKGGDKTTNEIAREVKCNWLTARRHLEYLRKYKRKVELKVSKQQVKIWGLRVRK